MKYIALEDCNLDWDYEEVKRFESLWKQGYSIFELKEILKRPQVEIVVLIMDRHRKGKIRERENGLFGGFN